MKFISFIKKLFKCHICHILLIFLFQIIKAINPPCNITHPILKEGKCVSIYCSEEDFNSSKCIINNDIIKTQWLTRMIPISDLNFRYINPVLTKNNDLIIQTSKSTGSPERKFFGIKENGCYYFEDSNGKEYPYFSINVTGEENTELYKKESISSIIYLSNDDTDYFLSIGLNENSYTELIDFKNKNISRVLTNVFYNYSIYSQIGIIFELSKNSNFDNPNHFYFISLLTKKDNIHYFNLAIYQLNTTNFFKNCRPDVLKSYNCSYTQGMTSCFEDISEKYIICFYQDEQYYFTAIVLESDQYLTEIKNTQIDKGESEEENKNIFLKSICLKENTGFFIYYKSIHYKYPFIQIKEWNSNQSEINDYNSFGLIYLNEKYNFNYNLYLNDIIKIKENQICFSSTSLNKENLYIVIFNFYDSYSKLKIRYYMIKLYELYNKKILFELKLTYFKNLLSISSNLCSYSNYNSNDYYSYLLILGYPNSTDIEFDLIRHLFYTNDNISNININFQDYVNIENNIFGYIYKGIKLIEIPEKISLSSFNYNEIKEKDILEYDTNILLSISLSDQSNKEEYIIKYALIISDPIYNNIDYYAVDFNYTYGDENEKDFYQQGEYVGRTSLFKIIKNNILLTTCDDKNCSLCYQEDNNNICLTCRDKFTILEKTKICKEIVSSLLAIPPTIIKEGEKCPINDIFEKKCNRKIVTEEVRGIYKKLKNILVNKNYTNENIMVTTENVFFQLSTLKDQKDLNISSISNIDIGDCENLLKKQENLNEEEQLIIIKIDLKKDDYQIIYVLYEIYSPHSHQKLNLQICKNVSIYINSPVSLSSDIENLYDSLNESGYNLFNSEDSFYNDICSPYTSQNGTDISMADRQKEIYNTIKNNSMCQNNCQFVLYNSTNKKSKCECEVQTEEIITTDIESINYKTELVNIFFNPIKNSNFLVLKCLKLNFSLKGQKGNIGSYIMSALLSIFIIITVLYFVLGHKKILKFIEEVINQKREMEKNVSKNNKTKRNCNKTIKKNKVYNIKNKQSNKTINNKRIKEKYKIKKEPPKKERVNKQTNKSNHKKEKLNTFINSSKSYINDNNKKLLTLQGSELIKKSKMKKKKNITNNNNLLIYDMKINNNSLKFDKSNNRKVFFNSTLKNNSKNEKYILNDFELNTLDYEMALKIDKRTYVEYYISLIKQKHLIIFTFYPSNDYNLLSIKISLFIISFSLHFTINAFFFSDETMHKIYTANGVFELLNQLPQILYSFIITLTINIILKYLSLSQKSILSIKKNKKINACIKMSKEVENCLKIKFILFFIFTFLFLCFFWYYISCFCAVYKNTQIILIEDTVISFCLSMLYPFGINLIPGLFRIPALRNTNNNKKCLYDISGYIALL